MPGHPPPLSLSLSLSLSVFLTSIVIFPSVCLFLSARSPSICSRGSKFAAVSRELRRPKTLQVHEAPVCLQFLINGKPTVYAWHRKFKHYSARARRGRSALLVLEYPRCNSALSYSLVRLSVRVSMRSDEERFLALLRRVSLALEFLIDSGEAMNNGGKLNIPRARRSLQPGDGGDWAVFCGRDEIKITHCLSEQ